MNNVKKNKKKTDFSLQNRKKQLIIKWDIRFIKINRKLTN